MAWIPFAIAAVSSAFQGSQSSNDAENNREFNRIEAEKSREFNAQQAQHQMDFQERMLSETQDWSKTMSETSYQRAVGDMMKAGLNPMLAYSQGGAPQPSTSVPSGAAGSSSPASSSSMPVRPNIGAQALSSAVVGAQIENVEADTDLKRATAESQLASAGQAKATTDSIVQGQIPKLRAEVTKIQSENITEMSRAALVDAQKMLAKVQTEVESGRVRQVDAVTALNQVEEKLKRLQLPEAEAYSEKFKGEWGKNASPYIREAVDILRALVYGRVITR